MKTAGTIPPVKIPLTILAVAALGATAFWYLQDDGEPPLDSALSAELATRAVPLVEDEISDGADRMACAVQPVGTEPASTRRAADVRVVYGWASCEARQGVRSGTLVPVAVHLAPATRVEYPADWDWSTGDRLDRIFPERLHDELLGGERSDETNAALESALQARLRDLAGR